MCVLYCVTGEGEFLVDVSVLFIALGGVQLSHFQMWNNFKSLKTLAYKKHF